VAALAGDGEPWCHWTNAAGQRIVKRAIIQIGGHSVDTLYSDYMFAWEELAGKPGKRLEEMIGKRGKRSELIADAEHAQRFYVPLPFWFTLISGNTLPLCALQFHGVTVHIEFERLENLIVVSEEGLQVLKRDDGMAITRQDMQAVLDTTYVFLETPERNKFTENAFDQLITQTQVQVVSQRSTSLQMSLPFNHPVVELIWMVRRKVNEDRNNWFDFSGLHGHDPLRTVTLRLNNLARFSGREARYYRLVTPYQFHTNVPKYHIYCYSFATDPENPQPSGTCNFSRIDNVDFTALLQSGLENEHLTLMMFCRSVNIFRYTEGLGGVKYTA
jgi:hypothetical protein